jgi:hypothetical protein
MMNRRFVSVKMRMTEREYRANIDGLNIFFGAVLGFVLAGAERLNDFWFGVLLALTAGIVVSILYITASKQRLAYSVLSLVLIASMGSWLEEFLPGASSIPAKLQPCLLVWALLTMSVEFLPREGGETDEITAA